VISHSLQIAGAHFALHLSRAARVALQFILLSVALVCYGAAPGNLNIQTEYEAQLQEEIASSGSHFDLRHSLRGAAQRRAGSLLCIVSVEATRRTSARSASAERASSCVSLGLALPLRC
jgi:hypothetical protein